MSGHFVEVCEIHGTRYGSCRCIGPHEQRKVPCQPARCNVTKIPPPPVSAEPRVLLEFEAEYIGDRAPMRLVRYGERWALEALRDGDWDPHVSGNALDVAVGIYESARRCWLPRDAMRAREVRE